MAQASSNPPSRLFGRVRRCHILFNVIASCGHSSTHRPQPVQLEVSMLAVASTVSAPIGQTAAQAPQPVHCAVSTAATKEVGWWPPTCTCAFFSLVALNSCSVARAWALRPWSSWSPPLRGAGGGGVVGADTSPSPIWGGGAAHELDLMPLPRPVPRPSPRPFPAPRPPPRPFPRPLPRRRAQLQRPRRGTRFKYAGPGRPAP